MQQLLPVVGNQEEVILTRRSHRMRRQADGITEPFRDQKVSLGVGEDEGFQFVGIADQDQGA